VANSPVTLRARGGSRGSSPSGERGRTLPIRTTLVTVAVGCLVLLYVLWWTTYAGIHFDQRYTQRPPGEPAQTGGTTIRVVSLTSTPLLADQKYAGPPEPAASGAVWVIAVLEATQPPGAAEFYCTVELLGPDGRRWEKESKFTRTLPYCGSDVVQPGPPVQFEMIFSVPERYVGQIVGVALLNPLTPERVDVVTPPA
jgi:hypothetical protein